MNYEVYIDAHYRYWERVAISSPYGEVDKLLAISAHKEALPALRGNVRGVEAIKLMKIVRESAECLTKEEFKAYE